MQKKINEILVELIILSDTDDNIEGALWTPARKMGNDSLTINPALSGVT